MPIDSVLDFAKRTVRRAIRPGALAVDATVGNGYDTRFLAEQVGRNGRVYGFDVQMQAIELTRVRLAEADVLERVTFVQAGHETMKAHLPPEAEGRVAAVMFNLGYLPGRDKTCITRPETTVAALRQSLRYVRPGGVVTVAIYTGHPGGKAEAEAVDAWAGGLDASRFRTLSYQFVNRPNDPPRLVVVEKMGSGKGE